MSKPAHCMICDKDNCRIDREIREGCAADAMTPEQCAICNRRSYIVNPLTGLATPCESCSRGFRLKLWLKHKDDCGQSVDPFVLATEKWAEVS